MTDQRKKAVRHALLLLPAAVSLMARLLFLLGADFLLTGMVANLAALASALCALLAAFGYRARATAALALVLPLLGWPIHTIEQMLFDRRLDARLDDYLAAGPLVLEAGRACKEERCSVRERLPAHVQELAENIRIGPDDEVYFYLRRGTRRLVLYSPRSVDGKVPFEVVRKGLFVVRRPGG